MGRKAMKHMRPNHILRQPSMTVILPATGRARRRAIRVAAQLSCGTMLFWAFPQGALALPTTPPAKAPDPSTFISHALLAQASVPTPSVPDGERDLGDESAIEEIVVTAQKREQGVQKTAIAITAIGGADLRTAGVASVSGLMNSVPNLQIGQSYGTAKDRKSTRLNSSH